MKKIDAFCDICGKKIIDEENGYVDLDIDCCDVQDAYDLCEECYLKLTNIVKGFLDNGLQKKEDM